MWAASAVLGPLGQGCCRMAMNLALAASFLVVFAAPSGSISAAIPIPISRAELPSAGRAEHVRSYFGGEEHEHRHWLIKRHEQISSGPVAAGFVHPTHLYRRDADALPAPDKAYNLTVTQGTISPDGFERLGFLMNGKFPADPFVWDENDDIEITVNNQSPVPFAIHWHGIHQIGSPEMDGVPGLSQWNIYTGESYTYRFKLVNQYGGYWYHSHERGYYADGLRGTIYIRPKAGRLKPWSLISASQDDIDQMEAAEKDFQIVQLSDHWHTNHTDMMLVVHETGVPPACFDSLHINGRGRQYCIDDWTTVISPVQSSLLQNFSSTNPDGITSKGCISLVPPKAGYTVKGVLDTKYGGVCKNTTAPLTVFSAAKAIKEGRKWLNLQIIDTATNHYYGVSIDSHKMWIVAVDGHYIEPMQVDWAQITIGSRLSVMVELDSSLDGNVFPIRLTGARALQPIEGHAFLSYIDEIDGSWSPGLEEDFGYAMRELTTAHVPMSGFVTDPSVVKWQQNQSVPFDPTSTVPETSNMTLHAVASQNSLNVWQVATMPLDTAHMADERPMLFNATDGNATSNQMKPYATIPFGTVVDIIMENNIYSIVGGPNSPHPFHMHSRRFWVLGSGAGPFPADTVAEAQGLGYDFNFNTAPLRDGFDIDSNSWVVIRYIVDHAAANILHCHIDDHFMEGMAAVLLEGLETIPTGGNFSESIKARPAKWVETQNDELGQVLEKSWATGSANAKYILPAVTETVTPWGDPRALANSIQLIASSNSVMESITSSLQQEMSLLQATATEEVTAVTATVLSDYLTTFTGVPASSEVIAAAAATAVATVTRTVAVETAAALDPAQSTVVAAAYTTRTATATALSTQATSPINVVPASATVVFPTTALASASTVEQAADPATALVTALRSASATAAVTAPATVYVTVLATTSASALAAAPAVASSSLAVVAPAASAIQSGSSRLIGTAAQAETSVLTGLSPATLIAYSTLFHTAGVTASASGITPSAVQPARTTASPEPSAATTAVDDSSDPAATSDADDQAADETGSGAVSAPAVTTGSADAALTDEVKGTAAATDLTNSDAALTRLASSTHVYSALQTQRAVSSTVAAAPTQHSTSTAAAPTQQAPSTAAAPTQQAPSTAAASLNRAASTLLSTTQVVGLPSETSAPTPETTESASASLSIAVSETQISTPPATQSAASSPGPAAYGTHAATATFAVDSTAAGLSSAAAPAVPSQTTAAVVSDEPAYDNPVFPPTTASATTSQRPETTRTETAPATITEPATTTAVPSQEHDATLDDGSHETYLSQ